MGGEIIHVLSYFNIISRKEGFFMVYVAAQITTVVIAPTL